MNRVPFRRLVALAGVLAVAGVASSCSSTLRNAATITFEGSDNTVDIERNDFEEQLRDVSEAQKVLEQTQTEESTPTTVDGNSSTVETALASNWLQTRIYAAAFEEMFDERELEIDDDARERARQGAYQSYGGEETFKEFPKGLQDELIRQQTLIEAIAADEQENAPEAADQPTEADVRAYFEENKDELTACESGKQVAHILVADEATANAIITQVNGGVAFSDLAAKESTDTGSAAQGGELGCLEPNAYVPEFQQAAEQAPIGEVVGPVQTSFGYHVILVTPFTATYDDLRAQILEQLRAEAQQSSGDVNERLLAALNDVLGDAEVDVDPRYGTWQYDEANAQYAITPPEAPSPREQREPTASTTTVPLSTGG